MINEFNSKATLLSLIPQTKPENKITSDKI